MEAIEKQTNEQEVIAKLNERLGQLKAASEIAVTDQESLVRSAAVKLDLEGYLRAVENAFEPELAPAEEKVRRLKISMSSLIQPAKQWLTALVNRQREWAAEEKRKAQREQDEINRKERERVDKLNAKAREEAKEKHAKIPEPVVAPVVAVQPNIPKVPGVRNQTYFKFRIVDATKVPRIYCVPDEAAIGRTVHTLKDKARTEALIPGVEVYTEG